MNTMMKQTIAMLLLLAVVLCATACGEAEKNVWDSATYTENTTFGEGKTTVSVEVKAEDKAVTFTLKTDKTTLADAMLEHALIAGEESEYGLYVKVVNGITADYDADGHYWSLCKGGDALMTGADATEIKDGEHYEFVYAK